ncbi:hypothetical protein Bca101_043795 [Brassica carinata]
MNPSDDSKWENDPEPSGRGARVFGSGSEPERAPPLRRGRPVPRSPRPWARTNRTEVTSPMGEDDPYRGHLAHGRGRPVPRSPRPWARTTHTEVTSPMGEDDPYRGHLPHG